MVMTISDTVKAELERGGSKPVYLVEMHLGPFAFLTLTASYASGALGQITVSVVWSGGSLSATYTEGVNFSVGAGTAAAAVQSMADAINADASMTDRISAYAFGNILVIHGQAYQNRIPATTPADTITISTNVSLVWEVDPEPVARIYRFITGGPSQVAADVETLLIPEVRKVENVSTSIDAYTREFAIGDIEIEFADPNESSVVRDILYRTHPKGRFVQIKVGTDALALADFVPVGGFVIDEVIPSRGAIHVTCTEVPSALQNKRYDGRAQPIQAIAIVDNATAGGVVINIELATILGRVVTSFVVSAGALASDTALNIRDAINADATITDRVSSAIEPSTTYPAAYILPYARETRTPWDYLNRVVRVVARSSNPGAVRIDNVESNGRTQADYVGPAQPGWINVHPLTALRDLYKSAGLATARVDEDSFDRTNYTAISHWAISAHDKHAMGIGDNSPIGDAGAPANERNAVSFDLQTKLAQLLQGGVVGDEEGRAKFIRRDTTASPVRHLTSDDYDEFVWQEQYQNQKNQVLIYGTAYGETNDFRVLMLHASDGLSIAIQANATTQENPDEAIIKHSFLGTFTQMSTKPNAAATSIVVDGAWQDGFAGARPFYSNDPTGLIAAQDQLSPTRPSYILLWQPSAGLLEVVKATASSVLTTYRRGMDLCWLSETAHRVASTTGLLQYLWTILGDASFTIERAQLNTTAQDFSANSDVLYACDITIAIEMANHVLSFAFGVPIASFRTTPAHIDLQLGDVITHDNRQYLTFLASGASTEESWEITGKEMEYPYTRYTIARLARRSTPVAVPIYTPPPIPIVTPVSTVVLTAQLFVTDNNDVNATSQAGDIITKG